MKVDQRLKENGATLSHDGEDLLRVSDDGGMEILAPDFFAGSAAALRRRMADRAAPAPDAHRRVDLPDGLLLDVPRTPAMDGDIVLRGGWSGVEPLARLRRSEGAGILGRSFAAYHIIGEEDIGPVLYRTPAGAWRVTQPTLLNGAADAGMLAGRAMLRRIEPARSWRVETMVPGSFKADDEKAAVVLINDATGETKEEREIPVFVLSRAPLSRAAGSPSAP